MEGFQIVKDWGVKVTCFVFPYLKPKYYYFDTEKEAIAFIRTINERVFIALIFQTGV